MRFEAENAVTLEKWLGSFLRPIFADWTWEWVQQTARYGISYPIKAFLWNLFVFTVCGWLTSFQAVGRIDRIGQTRVMTVHHFVVYGSVEEQIYYKYTDPRNKDWTVRSIIQFYFDGLAFARSSFVITSFSQLILVKWFKICAFKSIDCGKRRWA